MPAWVVKMDDPMMGKDDPKMMEDPKIRAMVETTQVLGLISPKEIAATAVFLASEETRCMTGQILSVHAGAF